MKITIEGPRDVWKLLLPIEFTERGCWEWNGARDSGDSPIFVYTPPGQKKRHVRIRRFFYEVQTGRTLKPKEYLKDMCGFDDCVNPSHLRSTDDSESIFGSREYFKSEVYGAKNWHIARAYPPWGTWRPPGFGIAVMPYIDSRAKV